MSALIGAIAAILAGFGERMVKAVFDRKERRRAELDADIELLERLVFEVRDLATQYWVSRGSEPIVEGSIVGRMVFISKLLDEVFDEKQELLQSMHTCINKFDMACTHGDFKSSNRLPEPGRCITIEVRAYTLFHTAKSLRRKLLGSYRHHF